MSFWKVNSREYEALTKRLAEVEGRLLTVELENVALRDKVLRKIQKQPEDRRFAVPRPTLVKQ